MYIVTCGDDCGKGQTIDEAIDWLENIGYVYDPEDAAFVAYEAKEIKVKRKFEIEGESN